jgi:hypothetical protein
MLCRSLIYLVLAVIGAGCGGGSGQPSKKAAAPDNENQQPAADKQADVAQEDKAPPRPGNQAAPKPVIYSSRELAKVLDLSALPALEGTKFGAKSAANVSAQAPGTVPDVSAFYQKNLSALGWELVPEPDRKNTDEYATLLFAKNGHRASLTISKFNVAKEKAPQTMVRMEFHGNLDTRTLPSPAGNQILSAGQTVTSYLTEKPTAEMMLWVPKALAAEGWQKFTGFDAAEEETGVHRTLKFRKQGYAVTIFIGIHPLQKKTHFQYMVSALGHELPTPPEATKVQFDDVRWKLACEVPGDWKAAAEFYQKAMPATGYQPLSSEDPRPTYWNLRFGTDAGDVIMVKVSSMDKQPTQVNIHGISAAALAAMKKRDDGKKPSKK